MYPEYQKKIKNEYHPPDHCERYCKCTSLFDCNRHLEVTMRTVLNRACLASGVSCWSAAACFAQPPQINPDTAKLTMAPVQGKVYVLMGDGGNITVQVGKDGVMLVDTGFAPLAAKAMAEIRKLSNGPVRWIVNTHVHPDHTGGNAQCPSSV